MDTVRISVLMTAYNNASLIGETIESVLNQTFTDFELLICDDASADDTWQTIENYRLKDQRIKTFRNEANLGIAANRNKLLSLAQGQYVAMHDNDDISLPERLHTQYEYMEKHPDVVACGSFLEYFDERDGRQLRTYPASHTELRQRLYRDCPIGTPSLFMRTDIARKAGGFGLGYKYTDDLDLYFRLIPFGNLANIQQVLVKYRRHSNANSIKNFLVLERETLEIRYKYKQQIPMS